MDPFSKKLLEELEQMQQHTGRILRSMSLSRMMPLESGRWQPAVDIYEAEDTVYVYADLAGVTSENLKVTATEPQLQISGVRQLPAYQSIACIHQLEIELGGFQRIVALPTAVEKMGVRGCHDLREGIRGCDVIIMLRLQNERMNGALLPSAREYFNCYGLTPQVLALAKPDAIVMHPGPMNRGVEIASEVADGPQAVILPQVSFGIAVRMAVMSILAGN